MAIKDPIEAVRFWLNDYVPPYTFTNAQIQEFLDMEKVPDYDGHEPDDEEWVPTYDILRAAGRGWIWRAGQAVNKPLSYRVGDVSVTFDKDYCMKRARELLGASSATLTRRDEEDNGETLARYR